MNTGRERELPEATNNWSSSRGRRVRAAGGLLTLVLATIVTSCQLIEHSADGAAALDDQAVVAAAGWTRIATTEDYIVVANVLPGERMFTSAEAKAEHPTEGELIIDGPGHPLGPDVRHVEAHIYDRTTGLPLTSVRPVIVVLNRTSGELTEVRSTLMQDVNIGAADIHFGNNVPVSGDSDLSLTVTIGDQEVTLDGHLD